MSVRPCLLVVTGPPGTGKTTMSRRLAADLHATLLNRDVLKEILFDTLGWDDLAWSRRVGGASYELLYYVLGLLMHTRTTCIVESNFVRDQACAKVATLVERYTYQVVQLCCSTETNVLRERINRRATSGERHPGHADYVLTEDEPLLGRWQPLDLPGSVIELDTTDWAHMNYPALLAQICSLFALT